MSEWVERVQNHPLNDALKNIDQVLISIEEPASSDTVALEARARIQQVIELTKRKLERIDPILIPVILLDNLNKQLQPVYQELNNYLSNKNPEHLRNASSHLDNALIQLGSLLVSVSSDDMGGLRDTMASFRKSAGQHLRNVDEKATDLTKQFIQVEKKMTEVGQEIQSQKSRLDQAIASFQDQFTKAQQERASQANAETTSRQEQFLQSEKARDQKYQQKFEELEKRLSQTAEKQTEDFKGFVVRTQTQADSIITNLTENAKDLIGHLESRKKEAEDLVHVIAQTGMAGGYQKVSDQEAYRALIWHRIGIGAMVGLVAFAIWAFEATLNVKVEWTVFGARVFVAATFALLATYAEKQANNHRKNEQLNRRWQLILSSLNPYLASLPEDKQQAIKQMVAEKIFMPTETSDNKQEPVTTNTLLDLLKTFAQNIGKK